MQLRTKKNLSWYEFTIFTPFSSLKAACFTSCISATDPISTYERTEALKTALFPEKDPTCFTTIPLYQTHGTNHQIIEQHFTPDLPTDGACTNAPYHVLTIRHADCQPAFFYDPHKNVIAAVHCGWRGSVQNMYAKTVSTLKTVYGCLPQDLLVGIGPSLGPHYAEFVNYIDELPPSFLPWDGKNRFDFWNISKQQLVEAGIPPSNIEIARICTYETDKQFFSYRRDKTIARNISCIVLKNPSHA